MSDGAFLGLVIGLGLLSIWWSMWEQENTAPRRGAATRALDQIGRAHV